MKKPSALGLLVASLIHVLGCPSASDSGSGGAPPSTSSGDGGAGTVGSNGTGASAIATGGAGSGGANCASIDDGNPCTDDVCHEGTAVHVPAPAGSVCSSGGARC